MAMQKRCITVLTVVIILLATPFAALAQNYSFSLDQENVIVFLNEDSSISLDYTFVFTNDSGAHAIDFVDVGMPNYMFEGVSADVNDTPVEISFTDYQGNGDGFAVALGSESIQPGQTGTVHVHVERVASVLNRDSQDTKYASFEFTPTWFGSEFVHGNTDLTVEFHLPPGIQSDEPRFHRTDPQWTGPTEPATDTDESGRIVYTWHAENANGHTPYIFGASFPLNYVPAYATELARPTIPPATLPAPPITPPQADSKALAGWIIVGFVIVLITGAASFLKYAESRDNRIGYLSPQISIEGYGIKRGLTAVEAAILLEQPLDKVLTMILFGVVKKGVAKITRRDPLQLEIVKDLPEDLYEYEKNFLEAFWFDDVRNREEKLQQMFVDLIKAVSEKMRGFSQDETQRHYRDIVRRAWQQVQETGTPELKNRELDQSFDWLMLNQHFGEDVQELFKTPGVTIPQWWSAYDQDFKLPAAPRTQPEERTTDSKIDFEPFVSRPHPEPASPARSESQPTARDTQPGSNALPGADYAAAIVNSVQDFSSRAIRNMGSFTERVHEVTNLRPVFSPEADPIENIFKYRNRDEERTGGSSASADGFFSSLFGSSDSSSSSSSSSSSHHSSSGSSSSSRHSSCACACAGCACACAGGGR